MGNGTQDRLISLIVLLALSGSLAFLGLMFHTGWISQEELTPIPHEQKGLSRPVGQSMPISQWNGMSLFLGPFPSWARSKTSLSWLCFRYLSYQSWSKAGVCTYAYCISVKVTTLNGMKGGKVHGIENEKAHAVSNHSTWERHESLSRCQPFHPTEDWRWMSFHSQVGAGSGV